MTIFFMFLFAMASTGAHAEEFFKIESGKDYKNYSNQELQRRVWELERAVTELQQKVFQMQAVAPPPVVVPTASAQKLSTAKGKWFCKIRKSGNVYSGMGATQEIANAKALTACKAAYAGDAVYCRELDCHQED